MTNADPGATPPAKIPDPAQPKPPPDQGMVAPGTGRSVTDAGNPKKSAKFQPATNKKTARLVVTIPSREPSPSGQTQKKTTDNTPRPSPPLRPGTQPAFPTVQEVTRPPTPDPAPEGKGMGGAPPLEAVRFMDAMERTDCKPGMWYVPVEGLGMGLAHLLGDAVQGITTLGGKRLPKQPPAMPPPAAPHVKQRREIAANTATSDLEPVIGRMTGGIRELVTGATQITGGSIDIVLGTLGTLGGIIVQTAGRLGIKTGRTRR
ncbi:MAG: hypothetical protein HQL84_18215 [Magnetococcales bacterium]|nr:hypothetical protein [Magnetococcales bacterium]